MKAIIRSTALLLLLALLGCENKETQDNDKKPAVFNDALLTLEKAKQVESVLQNSADNQRKAIEADINSPAPDNQAP